jgi:hypothetical protein
MENNMSKRISILIAFAGILAIGGAIRALLHDSSEHVRLSPETEQAISRTAEVLDKIEEEKKVFKCQGMEKENSPGEG